MLGECFFHDVNYELVQKIQSCSSCGKTLEHVEADIAVQYYEYLDIQMLKVSMSVTNFGFITIILHIRRNTLSFRSI